MTLYWSIYAVLAWLGMTTGRRALTNGLGLAVAVLLTLFIGTRFNTGCDFETYWRRYLLLYNDAGLMDILQRGERGFDLLNWTVHRLDLGYFWVLFVSAVICVAGIFRFSRFAPQPLLFVALSFPILIVQLSMSGLRQAIALAFLLFAFDAFIRVRRLQVAFWVLVASTFHQSAIIFLPLALIAGRRFRLSRILIALLLLSPLVGFFLQERLEVYDNRYITQIYGENSSSGAVIRFLLTALPLAGAYALRKPILRRHPELENILMLFFAISVAMLPLIAVSTVVLHRMTYYVMPVSLLAFIVVSKLLFSRDRALAVAIPALAYGGYMVFWFAFSRHAQSCYVPYETILLG